MVQPSIFIEFAVILRVKNTKNVKRGKVMKGVRIIRYYGCILLVAKGQTEEDFLKANKLTGNEEYSHPNRENLPLPIQMLLSKKLKTFCCDFIA